MRRRGVEVVSIVVMRRECAPGAPLAHGAYAPTGVPTERGVLDSDGRRALAILAGTFFSMSLDLILGEV